MCPRLTEGYSDSPLAETSLSLIQQIILELLLFFPVGISDQYVEFIYVY